MSNENYMLSVYNTISCKFEDVEVNETIFHEFRRSGWRIEYNDSRFRDHETTFSDLRGNWENFREFLSERDDPACMLLKNWASYRSGRAMISHLRSDHGQSFHPGSAIRGWP